MASKYAFDGDDTKRFRDGETDVRAVKMTVTEARKMMDALDGSGPTEIIEELDEAQGAVHGQPGKVSYLVIRITG